MQCPKCQSEFETVLFDAIEIDRCRHCGGIWFDASEREALQRRPGAAATFDVGSKAVGRTYDELRRCLCPRCGGRMSTVADQFQFHIEFENCNECGGTFFDAGEFKDLARLTPLERLRKLVDVWLAVR